MSVSVTLLLIVVGLSSVVAGPPHIIFIVADDLGERNMIRVRV